MATTTQATVTTAAATAKFLRVQKREVTASAPVQLGRSYDPPRYLRVSEITKLLSFPHRRQRSAAAARADETQGNHGMICAIPLRPPAGWETLAFGSGVRGRTMANDEAGYDYHCRLNRSTQHRR